MTTANLLQLAPQHLHHLPDRLLIPPVPAPLAMLGGFNQSRVRQNRHVVRDRRLRQLNSLLNVAAAQAGTVNVPGRRNPALATFFEHEQDAAPGRISNGVESAVERCFGRHADYRYREN